MAQRSRSTCRQSVLMAYDTRPFRCAYVSAMNAMAGERDDKVRVSDFMGHPLASSGTIHRQRDTFVGGTWVVLNVGSVTCV